MKHHDYDNLQKEAQGSRGIKVTTITMGKRGSRQALRGLEQQAEGSHLKHKQAAERVSSKQVSVYTSKAHLQWHIPFTKYKTWIWHHQLGTK